METLAYVIIAPSHCACAKRSIEKNANCVIPFELTSTFESIFFIHLFFLSLVSSFLS